MAHLSSSEMVWARGGLLLEPREITTKISPSDKAWVSLELRSEGRGWKLCPTVPRPSPLWPWHMAQ